MELLRGDIKSISVEMIGFMVIFSQKMYRQSPQIKKPQIRKLTPSNWCDGDITLNPIP